MPHMDADLVYWEKAGWKLHKSATSNIEQILEATSHKTAAVQLPISNLYNQPNKTNKTCENLLKKYGRTF